MYLKNLKVGDKVRVTIPSGDIASAKSVRPFDGKITIVKGIRHYKVGNTYILNGCKSSHGIPFEFVAEWLTLVEGVKDEVTE